MKSCFFATLASVALMAAPVRGAVNQWTVTPGAPGPGGTISVTVDVTVSTDGCGTYMCPGPCMMNPPSPHLTVTPCPEGVTCTGGSYSRTYNPPPWTDTFVLRCGVLYTFAGSWDQYVFMPMSIPQPPYMICATPCSCGGPFQPTTFMDGATPTGVTSWGRLKVMYR
jgi:hypothetical protein